MQNNTIVFLSCSRKESRNVYQGYQRNIECIAETNEAGTLTRCIAVKYTCQIFGLVGNHTYRLSVHTGKSDDNILGIIFLYFEEFAIIDDSTNHLIHIVWLIRAVRNNLIQKIIHTVDRICTLH